MTAFSAIRFHIHDVQFKIVSRSDGPVASYEQGWKDTLYIPRGTSATFIARFDDYASDTDPFMYHCHMANHEDGGLMGQFLVSREPAAIKRDATGMIRFRDCIQYPLTAAMIDAAERQAPASAPVFRTADLSGQQAGLVTQTQTKPLVLFFIERQCPCARDAAAYFTQLQTAYGDTCKVVGIINASPEVAQEWVKSVAPGFPLLADPNLAISNAYGAQRAVCTTLVAPGGKIVKSYPGYGAPMLRELSSTIARIAGIPERTLTWKGAPEEIVAGCPLMIFEERQAKPVPLTMMR